MGPPIPHDLSRPPERDPKTLKAIAARWGPAAVDQLYTLFANGTRYTRFVSRGRLAWVHADTPGPAGLFVRAGATFAAFPTSRWSGGDVEAFAAILADGQIDVVAEQDNVIAAFASVTGAEPVLTQEEADALLQPVEGADTGADPNAVAQFEPPHFRGRTLAFVVTYPYAAELVRVLVDADTLGVRTEPLGRSQRHYMPVG
jgi:hypothetical protein